MVLTRWFSKNIIIHTIGLLFSSSNSVLICRNCSRHTKNHDSPLIRLFFNCGIYTKAEVARSNRTGQAKNLKQYKRMQRQRYCFKPLHSDCTVLLVGCRKIRSKFDHFLWRLFLISNSTASSNCLRSFSLSLMR